MEEFSSSSSSSHQPDQDQPSSPSRSELLPPNSTVQNVAKETKIQMTRRLEILLRELVRLAYDQGLFFTIPPCHSHARLIAEEIATFIDNHKKLEETDNLQKEALKKLIYELDNVDIEKLEALPGYEQVMEALQQEVINYFDLAANRGRDDWCRVLQFIAHFPKVGHILNSLNDSPNKPRLRYEAVMASVGCDIELGENESTETAITRADERLDKMNEALEKTRDKLLVDNIPRKYDGERMYRLSQGENLSGWISAVEFDIRNSISTICGYDKDAAKMHDLRLRMQFRQQQLITRVQLYSEEEDLKACEEIKEKLNAIDNDISENDEKTKKALFKHKQCLEGPFEVVRDHLGTPSGLLTKTQRMLKAIRALEHRSSEYHFSIRSLECQLKEERVKNQALEKEKKEAEKKIAKLERELKAERENRHMLEMENEEAQKQLAKKKKAETAVKTPAQSPAPAPKKQYKKRSDEDDDKDYVPPTRDRTYKTTYKNTKRKREQQQQQ